MIKMRYILTLVIICLLFPIGASAYTVYVSVDGSLDFTRIDRFQFDANAPNVNLNNDVTLFTTVNPPPAGLTYSDGAFPITDDEGWVVSLIAQTEPLPDQVYGLDFTGGNNLAEGVLLSITKPDAFTLSDFSLQEFFAGSYPDYPFPFTVTENPVTDGVEYIYTAVPIPGSLLLMGSGLLGVVVMRRKWPGERN